MLRISKRDNDVMEEKYDPEDFDPEFKSLFQNNFNAVNLVKELFAEGYCEESSIAEQFKLRNYEVTADIKKVIKAILKKLESKSDTQ